MTLRAIKKTHATVAVVAEPGAQVSKIPNKNRQFSSDAFYKIVQEKLRMQLFRPEKLFSQKNTQT